MRFETFGVHEVPRGMYSTEEVLEVVVEVVRACERRDNRTVIALLAELPSPPDVCTFVEVTAWMGLDLASELRRVLSEPELHAANYVLQFLDNGPRRVVPLAVH